MLKFFSQTTQGPFKLRLSVAVHEHHPFTFVRLGSSSGLRDCWHTSADSLAPPKIKLVTTPYKRWFTFYWASLSTQDFITVQPLLGFVTNTNLNIWELMTDIDKHVQTSIVFVLTLSSWHRHDDIKSSVICFDYG